jgi:hypothetical protein
LPTATITETREQMLARHQAEIAALIAARPGDFEASDAAEGEAADSWYLEKSIEFTRKHLRRYPKTQCALALSLKALYEGNASSYIR